MHDIAQAESDDEMNNGVRHGSHKAQAPGEFFNDDKDQGMETTRSMSNIVRMHTSITCRRN